MVIRRIVAGVMLIALAVLNAHAQPSGSGRILKLEEMTYPAIDEIDRERSAVFLTFGNLEEHGPHIPIGADTYQALAIRDAVVELLRESHPDFDIVLVPVIPLGEGGANLVADEPIHIGTYAVRYSTLRNVAIDMGSAIAENGFKNIFLIHQHGARRHNLAFTEAAGFVSDHFDSQMVNVTSLVFADGFYSDDVVTEHLGEGWQEKIGITGHAGAAETSANLFAHDLVDPIYKSLEPFVVPSWQALSEVPDRDGWQGYWNDPSQATVALGEALINDLAERSHRFITLALAGEDLSVFPSYPTGGVDVPDRDLVRQAEIDAWLAAQPER